ncbi:MAG: flagellar biosynthesis protein FlhF [Candidatus Thiodiazotropha sp.]
MKIRRFFASDMRQALRRVRDALGADAVILSNKTVEGGVELVAAIDYDESAFNSSVTGAVESPDIKPVGANTPANSAASSYASVSKALPPEEPETPVRKPMAFEPKTEKRKVEWSQDPILREMRQEMQALRRMMENELSELTWRDLGQRRPQTQELMRQLMSLGLDAAHCRELAYRVEDAESLDQAWQQALNHLCRELPVAEDDLISRGGVFALIGPTGVGKTTTIAKLAAKFCLRHGNRHLALISADSYRIGAQEQLQNYGRILDVPVRNVTSTDELNSALHAFAEKRLVLIDTAGMGQKDIQLTQRLALLSRGNHPVQPLLTLAATTQRSALSHAIRAFSQVEPVAVVLTKMDETASLGGALSALLESRLPLAYTTDGQRVPEDLRQARAESMTRLAVELTQQTDEMPDEEYLAMAFGGMSEHAHV